MDLTNRSFLKLLDHTPEEIEGLLDLAADLKAKKKAGIRHDALHGKNIASSSRRPPPAPAAALRSPPTTWAWKSPTSTRRAARSAKRSPSPTPPGCWAGCSTASSTALRPEHRGRAGPLRRCAGVEWPDQRVPPHPDPRRLPHHPGALRPPQGHQLRLLRRRPLQHGQQPDGGCAKMGLNFTACAPKKYQPDAALVEQCRAIAAETGAAISFEEDPAKAAKAQTSSTPTSGCPWASRSKSGPSASTTWPHIRSTSS